eukprot:gene10573-7343_t
MSVACHFEMASFLGPLSPCQADGPLKLAEYNSFLLLFPFLRLHTVVHLRRDASQTFKKEKNIYSSQKGKKKKIYRLRKREGKENRKDTWRATHTLLASPSIIVIILLLIISLFFLRVSPLSLLLTLLPSSPPTVLAFRYTYRGPTEMWKGFQSRITQLVDRLDAEEGSGEEFEEEEVEVPPLHTSSARASPMRLPHEGRGHAAAGTITTERSSISTIKPPRSAPVTVGPSPARATLLETTYVEERRPASTVRQHSTAALATTPVRTSPPLPQRPAELKQGAHPSIPVAASDSPPPTGGRPATAAAAQDGVEPNSEATAAPPSPPLQEGHSGSTREDQRQTEPEPPMSRGVPSRSPESIAALQTKLRETLSAASHLQRQTRTELESCRADMGRSTAALLQAVQQPLAALQVAVEQRQMLEATLETLRDQFAQEHEAYTALQEEVPTLRSRLEEAERRAAQLRREKADTQRLSTASGGAATVEEKDAAPEGDAAQEAHRNLRAAAQKRDTGEVMSLQQQLREAQQRVADLETEVAHLTQQATEETKRLMEKEQERVAAAAAAAAAAAQRWTQKLEAAELRIEEAKRDAFEQREEVDLAREREAELKGALATAKKELQAAEAELQKQKGGVTTVRQQYEQQLTTLATRSKNMQLQMKEYEQQMNDIEAVITDALHHAGVDVPGEDLPTVLDLANFFATEFRQLSDATNNAEVVQSEWERTYQKAKAVNQSLQQQVNDAWRTVGELRETLSLKEEAATRLESQTKEAQRRCEHLQAEIGQLTQQLEALQTRQLREEVAEHEGELQQQSAALLQTELDKLHQLLREREEELLLANTSAENLQHAIDSFKATREADIAAQTAHLQMDLVELRRRLDGCEDAEARHKTEVSQLKQLHEKQMNERFQELTHLHAKLSELRKKMGVAEQVAGGPAARPLDGGDPQDLVDKQLLAQVFANFIHAFVEQRRETPEILKVLCGLLSWDEAMQEKVGLLPGPANPQPPQRGAIPALQPPGGGGRLGRLAGWRQRLSVGRQQHPAPSTPTAGAAEAPARQGSIAALWVDFLMRESDGGDDIHKSQAPRGEQAAAAAPPPAEEDVEFNMRGATPLRPAAAGGGGGTFGSTPTSRGRGESPLPRPLPPRSPRAQGEHA